MLPIPLLASRSLGNALVVITNCGPSDEFDPVVSVVGGGTWFMDDGHVEYVASGANLVRWSLSFCGVGPHRAYFKPSLVIFLK